MLKKKPAAESEEDCERVEDVADGLGGECSQRLVER
jgi:hypothetical protein